jgi:MoaA/NifB/PqqE/SkfB family radical SAM enzyme
MLRSLIRQLYRPSHDLEAATGDWTSEPYYDVATLTRRIGEKAASLRAEYVDYPFLVHLETLAVCNAACEFCPYPRLARKGARMTDALIEKVIGDLSDMPPDLVFQLAPYKVSDPFLEPRLFDIIELAAARLPAMHVSLITNGAGLTERKIDRLKKLERVSYLHVSLNYDDAQEYERVMKLPFDRTLARLDLLHRKKALGELNFPVGVTRVAVDRESDRDFMQWVRSRYPAFRPLIAPRNDWIGEVVTEGSLAEVPDAPCHRWFDLSITATGVVAMCCMDGEAQYPKGDVNHQHALEIYNQPRLRELRQTLISRRAAGSPCSRCTYLSY